MISLVKRPREAVESLGFQLDIRAIKAGKFLVTFFGLDLVLGFEADLVPDLGFDFRFFGVGVRSTFMDSDAESISNMMRQYLDRDCCVIKGSAKLSGMILFLSGSMVRISRHPSKQIK